MTDTDMQQIHDRAYAAVDGGALDEAARDFERLLQHAPDNPWYHYMQGLVHKYRRDWEPSLRYNLHAIALSDEFNQAQHWNAAIAATALGQWAQARELWSACGIALPDGDGPIDGDYGIAVVRLNPWQSGETVFVQRIDPVRARILNVPLPESGHRYGDIVLHDGASTGQRAFGERTVPVFNALERVQPSDFRTFVAFVQCAASDDLDVLRHARLPGIVWTEDWTESVRYCCLRCSYGAPHAHAGEATDEDDTGWQAERNLGIAAQSRKAVDKLLHDWVQQHPGCRIDAVEAPTFEPPACAQGHAWWLSPEDDADEDKDAG